MEKQHNQSVPERLRALRDRSGMSRDALAKAIGLRGASSYQRYESSDYKKKYIPVLLAEQLSQVLSGKGTPPIIKEEVLSLAGVRPATDLEKSRFLSTVVKSEDNSINDQSLIDIERFIEVDWRTLVDQLSTPERVSELNKIKSSNSLRRDVMTTVFRVVAGLKSTTIDMKKVPLDIIFMASISAHDVAATAGAKSQEELEDIARSTFIKSVHGLVLMRAGLFNDVFGASTD